MSSSHIHEMMVIHKKVFSVRTMHKLPADMRQDDSHNRSLAVQNRTEGGGEELNERRVVTVLFLCRKNLNTVLNILQTLHTMHSKPWAAKRVKRKFIEAHSTFQFYAVNKTWASFIFFRDACQQVVNALVSNDKSSHPMLSLVAPFLNFRSMQHRPAGTSFRHDWSLLQCKQFAHAVIWRAFPRIGLQAQHSQSAN